MRFFISLLTLCFITFISACDSESEFVVIEECEDIETMQECRDCCVQNGYDHGSPSQHAGACECWIED